MSKIPLLIVVMGPTASGKTAYAINLAKKHDAEIFSADSRQFYAEMNIGVAKPTQEELAEANHHFIGHISIHDEYTAGDYERDCLAKLNEYFKTKQTAILVGGS
ncbi:MAG: isopentenyl transferase family protein, partial [Bacteroidia bacterium]